MCEPIVTSQCGNEPLYAMFDNFIVLLHLSVGFGVSNRYGGYCDTHGTQIIAKLALEFGASITSHECGYLELACNLLFEPLCECETILTNQQVCFYLFNDYIYCNGQVVLSMRAFFSEGW